jgi:hypothetical protein
MVLYSNTLDSGSPQPILIYKVSTMKSKKDKIRKFKYERKMKISLGEYGELVYVWKANVLNQPLEFSVTYRAVAEGRWYTIRRHCWTQHQDRFHTHVRIGFGKGRSADFKKIYPPQLRGSVKRALNWAKADMMRNWYVYLQSFNKLVINKEVQNNDTKK